MFPPGTKSFVQEIIPAANKVNIIYINWINFNKSDVLTTVLPNIQVFWDVTHCHYVRRSQILEDKHYLHRQGQTFLLECLTLNMKTLWSFWTSWTTCPVISITFEKNWKFILSFNYRTGNLMT
jgi:hypothetical protein